MIKNKIKLLLSLLILLSSCQAIKDGLTGKKNDNSDEFLVKKKNPLELPPDFDELPAPTCFVFDKCLFDKGGEITFSLF